MIKIPALLTAALLSVVIAVMVYTLFVVAASVGPNCPDKDPSWEGWCSEAPNKI